MSRIHRTKDKLAKLTDMLQAGGTLLLVMQDNPDPDAIASAAALRELANSMANVSCLLAYGDSIGRAENRELAHYLVLKLHRFSKVKRQQYDLVALVDTQPGTGNNPLPAGFVPDIIIDHHPIRRATRSAHFTDVRSHYGATSTILWEYLSAAKIAPEMPLATALLYGIRSDTQDLGRESTKADIEAMEALYPLANKRMLGQIQRGRVPATYYQILATALTRSNLYGSCAITDLGDVDNPDMIGEVADLLLRHEKVRWTLCYGFHDGRDPASRESRLLLSLRTQDTRRRADDIMRRIVHQIGTGGGHTTMAGGQIPIHPDRDRHSERARIERLIRQRLLRALRATHRRAVQLVQLPAKSKAISRFGIQ